MITNEISYFSFTNITLYDVSFKSLNKVISRIFLLILRVSYNIINL